MNKSFISGIATLLGLLGAAHAQVQQTPPDPKPSTSQTEGTAADRTQPGETPTQGSSSQPESAQPSTSPTEGTAADRTPPGETPTAQEPSQGSEIVGAAVVTPADAPLGEVVDVVFDAKSKPAFVVISAEGESLAVPYAVADSMKTEDKIVIDRERVRAAPKVKEGEWRSQSGSDWKSKSTRYWDRG